MANLACVAGYLHDVGNMISRESHGQTGGILVYEALRERVAAADLALVVAAIANHEEVNGAAVSPVSAAVILADKSDVHRSRVRKSGQIEFDIHDRVNFAAEQSFLRVDSDGQDRHARADDRYPDQPGHGVLRDLPRADADVPPGRRECSTASSSCTINGAELGVRKTRALWFSILFVLILAGGSLALFATGTKPVLGLDLEGGVSVILSAPEGTPPDVMDQALENIRTRVDAFGTAEPLLFVRGTNIEVQIPGLARGTIQARRGAPVLPPRRGRHELRLQRAGGRCPSLLDEATVEPVEQSVCLTGLDGFEADPQCFGSSEDADAAVEAMAVSKQRRAVLHHRDRARRGPLRLRRPPGGGGGDRGPRAGRDADVLRPVGQARPSSSDFGGACFPTEEEAQSKLDELTVTRQDQEFCVVSSADRRLGCFLNRDDAEARLQETGQDRLLQVIGQTARLEFREVREELTPDAPGYAESPVDCGTIDELDTEACSFESLEGAEVTFYDRAGQTKYKLGPVEMTGDAITSATAALSSAAARGRAGSSTSR